MLGIKDAGFDTTKLPSGVRCEPPWWQEIRQTANRHHEASALVCLALGATEDDLC